tara:strand:- start:511 stop:2070 length:1560 start_codon:yes stop_codon:yes gene_type:complete
MKANTSLSNVFTVPFFEDEIKEDSIFFTNILTRSSQEKIIDRALLVHSQGKIDEAKKYYQFLYDRGLANQQILNNYGSIYLNMKDYQRAKILFKKSIKLYPNSSHAYANLALLYRQLKKLDEAKLFTLKAIKINPNSAIVHYNLGLIYKDLKNIDQATLSIKKALKLKSNFAEAHNLYASLLREIGKLDESVISAHRAIKFKPEYIQAYLNLARTLRYLGKFEEALEIYNKILKADLTNIGFKLETLTDILIIEFLRGSFNKIDDYLKQISYFINIGALEQIEEKMNREHTFIFYKFISILFPKVIKNSNLELNNIIPHIGESHCLSFAHNSLLISSKIKYIKPILIEGGKAWHFANNKNNKWKSSLLKQIENFKSCKEIFISFGEIDCREDEGILYFAKKYKLNIHEVCKETIKSYVDFMEINLSDYFSTRYYFGVPAPVIQNLKPTSSDIQRIELIKIYNKFLKIEVLKKGCFFVDLFELTADDVCHNNKIHMCDNTHLSPNCLPLLFHDYLYRTLK